MVVFQFIIENDIGPLFKLCLVESLEDLKLFYSKANVYIFQGSALFTMDGLCTS